MTKGPAKPVTAADLAAPAMPGWRTSFAPAPNPTPAVSPTG